jgi:hypothetical protein
MQYVPTITGRLLSYNTYLQQVDAFYALTSVGSLWLEVSPSIS